MGEPGQLRVGAICHVEIPAPDLEKAKRFYGEVFGWKLTPSGDRYVVFDDGAVGGGLDQDGRVRPGGGTVLVLAVADIPAKLVEIEKAGGKTAGPKTEIGGGMGFYAYFDDPNGNRLGIWSRT